MMRRIRKYRKIAAVVLAVIFIVFTAGCGRQQETTEAAQPDNQETAEETPEVMPAPVTVTGRAEDDQASLAPAYSYTLSDVFEVDGRQGIAWEGGRYYVSGSTTLSCYEANRNAADAEQNAAEDDANAKWNLVASNDDPFKDFDIKVNHLGDIDVYNGEIYAGAENFTDGAASDIQIAVYDAKTLEMTRSFMFDENSGQTECSGIAVDPDSGSVFLCSWPSDDSSHYIYRYDLETGEYLGKHHLQMTPEWVQGIAYYDGWLYITADDGAADLGEPDHIYKCKADVTKTAWTVSLERTLDDVKMQGEIEGISFDRDNDQMLVSYNRGSRIVLGMVKGFYEGYTEEIHEIYVYDMSE